MTDAEFGYGFVTDLVRRILDHTPMEELRGPAGGPHLDLVNAADGAPAGFLRLWRAPQGRLDRMIHFRLQSAPVDTQLLFLFGDAGTCMPHFHGQVVQFAPDACVYNADLLPRLDPVDHPDYFREVYGPVTKAYWKATGDEKNACSRAPGNPAMAVYLSPWSIAAGRPTTRADLERVTPSIHAYLDHALGLAAHLRYAGPDAATLRERDRRHMALFQSDELDPRAWKGVYRVVGDDVGQRIKSIFREPLR